MVESTAQTLHLVHITNPKTDPDPTLILRALYIVQVRDPVTHMRESNYSCNFNW